jgi:hypothetical protein
LVPSFTSLIEQANKFTNDLDTQFNSINIRLDKIMALLDTLISQNSQNTNLINSAIATINGLAALVTAAGTDPVKLKALTDAMKAQDDALATSIIANTPVVVEGSAWTATNVYALGDTVTFTDGNTYSSLIAENVGNSPDTSTADWAIVPVVTVPPVTQAAVKAS